MKTKCYIIDQSFTIYPRLTWKERFDNWADDHTTARWWVVVGIVVAFMLLVRWAG